MMVQLEHSRLVRKLHRKLLEHSMMVRCSKMNRSLNRSHLTGCT